MEFSQLFTYMGSHLKKRRRVALENVSARDGQITTSAPRLYIPIDVASNPTPISSPSPQQQEEEEEEEGEEEEEEEEEEEQQRQRQQQQGSCSPSPPSSTPSPQEEEQQQIPSTPPSPSQQQQSRGRRHRVYDEARTFDATIRRRIRRHNNLEQENLIAKARYRRRQVAELAVKLDIMDTEEQDALLLKRMNKISAMVVTIIWRCHYQHHDDSCQLVITRLMQDADVKVDDGFSVICNNVVERLVPYQKATLNAESHEYNADHFIFLAAWGSAVSYTHITFAAMDSI